VTILCVDICFVTTFLYCCTKRCLKKDKGKAEHLYSALHGIQTTLKRSGMDHTAFNLQRTPCQDCRPLPRKRSPDGASTECVPLTSKYGSRVLLATYKLIAILLAVA